MSIYSQNDIVRSTLAVEGHGLTVEHPAGWASREGVVWLFVHGIAASSSFWWPLMPERFRDNEPWLSVSLPVHAPSSGPEGFSPGDVTPGLFSNLLSAVLDERLPGRDLVVVGHSTGGFAGLCLALARPDRVRGVVSVGGFADGRWVGLEGAMQQMARRERLGVFGPMALRAVAWLTTRWPWLHVETASRFAHDRRAFLADEPTRRALRALRHDARLQDHGQLIAFFSGIRDVDIWDRLAGVRQPVLVLGGDHDPVIPREKTHRLAGALPNGHLLLYADTGHMVMNERRERFWHDIQCWRRTVLEQPNAGVGR